MKKLKKFVKKKNIMKLSLLVLFSLSLILLSESALADLNDTSGNGNHLTIFGNPSLVTGYSGTAYHFDGVDDYLRADDSDDFSIFDGQTSGSIEFWAKTDVIDRLSYIMGKVASSNYEFAMQMQTSERIRGDVYQLTSAGHASATHQTVLSADEWTHYSFVHNGTALVTRINGVDTWISRDTTLSGTPGNGTANFHIARWGTGDSGVYWDGLIDNVRLYDRALTEMEIMKSYTDREIPASPVVRYDFDNDTSNGNSKSYNVTESKSGFYTFNSDHIVYDVVNMTGVSLDGLNDFFYVPNNAGITPYAEDNIFTMCTWLQADNASGLLYVLNKFNQGANTNSDFRLEVDDDDITFVIFSSGGSSSNFAFNRDFHEDDFSQICVAANGTDLKPYYNGAAAGAYTDLPFDLHNGSTGLRGGTRNNNEFHVMNLSKVTYWDYAMDSGGIMTEFHNNRLRPNRVIPYLTFHEVILSNESFGSVNDVTNDTLDSFMSYLFDEGYESINLTQFTCEYNTNYSCDDLPEKPVVIGFDDSFLSDLTIAAPILQNYGFAGVSLAITGQLNGTNPDRLNDSQQLELVNTYGWDVGAQSVNHCTHADDPGGTPCTSINRTYQEEMNESFIYLTDLLGRNPLIYSYPGSDFNTTILDYGKLLYLGQTDTSSTPFSSEFARTDLMHPFDTVIFNNASTLAQFKIMMNTTHNNPSADYRFDELSGRLINDYSGNDNFGVIGSHTWINDSNAATKFYSNETLEVNNLSNALVYNSRNEVLADSKSGALNISFNESMTVYVLSDFEVEEGNIVNNSPIWFSSTTDNIKNIASNLTSTVNLTVKFNVSSCERIVDISYLSELGTSLFYSSPNCNNEVVTLTNIPIDTASSSNKFTITYSSPSIGGGGGGTDDNNESVNETDDVEEVVVIVDSDDNELSEAVKEFLGDVKEGVGDLVSNNTILLILGITGVVFIIVLLIAVFTRKKK